MSRRSSLLLAALLAHASLAQKARADLGPLEPIADLHRAVHESLGLPEPLIVQLLERGLPEPELPVVGLLAQQARVPVEQVVDLRLGGMSFVDISIRLGPGPAAFYVPFPADPGPPYGKAWGHYKSKPRSEWRTIRLVDSEVIALSNLKLCMRHYRVGSGEVIALQRAGHGFAAIHRELGSRHGARAVEAQGRGKDKDRGHPGKIKPPKANGKPPHRG